MTLRFLADEHVLFPSIALLRESGYDVASVAELAPSTDDPTAIRIARESKGSPTEAAERLLRLLADPKRVLASHFTTHGRGTTRPRSLPRR